MIFHRFGAVVGLIMAALLSVPAAHADQQQHMAQKAAPAADAPAKKEKPKSHEEEKTDPTPGAHAPVVFTLRTGIAEGRMVYIGVGGDIDHKINPTLVVHEGETVQINLVNGEGAQHDVVVDQYAARSPSGSPRRAATPTPFRARRT